MENLTIKRTSITLSFLALATILAVVVSYRNIKVPGLIVPGTFQEALIQAAVDDNVESARDAITSGAEVNLKDEFGMTPLHWAVSNTSLKVARLLLENGADQDIIGPDNQSTRKMAVNSEKMRALLDQFKNSD